jgi:hypothetical protein
VGDVCIGTEEQKEVREMVSVPSVGPGDCRRAGSACMRSFLEAEVPVRDMAEVVRDSSSGGGYVPASLVVTGVGAVVKGPVGGMVRHWAWAERPRASHV